MKIIRLTAVWVGLLIAIPAVSVLQAPVAAAPLLQEDDPRSQAEALYYEGRALYQSGQRRDALQKFEIALPLYQAAGYHEGEALCLTAIGFVRNELFDFSGALDAFEASLLIWREIGYLNGIGTSLNNIGAVYDNKGQYSQALDSYHQALLILQEIGNREGVGKTLSNIGEVYDDMGQYAQARDSFQQALAISQEIENSEQEGNNLYSLGTEYANLGQLEHALRQFQQALAIQQEIGDQRREAITLNSIAAVYGDLGQREKALNFYQQALALAQQSGDLYEIGRSLDNIGTDYHRQGDYEEALEYYRQALAIWEEMKTSNKREKGRTLDNIGQAHTQLGNFSLALEYLQQALAIKQEIGDQRGETTTLNSIGAVNSDLGKYELALNYLQQALTIADESGDPVNEWKTLGNIGFLYEQLGDASQAITFYQQGIDVFETIQGEIHVEDLKTSFTAQHVLLYEQLIDLLWEEERYEEAFEYAERARARAFLDQLAGGAVDFRAGADATLLEREQELKAEIAALRAQLVALRNRPTAKWDTEAIATAQAELTTLEADYEALLTGIKLQSPEVAGLVSVDVASLADVQALLDPNTTLVEYFVTEERTLAFIITRDAFEIVPLDVSREDLAAAITAFRDFASLGDPHPDSLQQLNAWLIAPVEPHLTTPVVGAVPHGVLHYLPFAALTDGERYLSDDYVLFTLPSASVLRFIQEKRKPETDTLLALGNPTIAEPLPALRFAEQEAEAIADLYGTQPLVGPEATENAVWSGAGQAGVLHLAAHGEYNPFNPLFSAIHLAADDQHDGRLEVHEIYGLDLTAATDLVVLSACQTQIGELSAGDEVVGLNRAFLYAGTPSVMASLWSVDDEATALLMERFYTHLQAGMGKAEALRQAQIEVRAEYPHPYYWAAFVLTGDADEVTGEVVISVATPMAEATTAPVEETPRAEETSAPAKGGGGPCPAGALILALGVGVAFIATGRGTRYERHQLSGVADQG